MNTNNEKEIAIVGAGLSGSVIARELANKGVKVKVFDSRNHVAGNCYTERDKKTGILVHVYGPHIFHTNDEDVWSYVNKYAEFIPFVNRVKAIAKNSIYSLPINLMTINQFYGKVMTPHEAKLFISEKGTNEIELPITFEQQALKFIGKELYQAFFEGYTKKQWGISPKNLPAEILKRLPVRFDYNDSYYNSKYQGLPKDGYTNMVQNILDHKNIKINLNTEFDRSDSRNFKHTFYSGPLDKWFNYSQGELGYRTLDFEKIYEHGDFQGNPVINYCDEDIPWTRITEHKHFSPWESFNETILYKERSRACNKNDIPYYPIRLINDKNTLSEYEKLVSKEYHVSFVGRLGTYRYLDMDVTIKEALKLVENVKIF
jgi:UDP-galactopyranose mutase